MSLLFCCLVAFCHAHPLGPWFDWPMILLLSPGIAVSLWWLALLCPSSGPLVCLANDLAPSCGWLFQHLLPAAQLHLSHHHDDVM